jgi:single-strand DNA-binding protein
MLNRWSGIGNATATPEMKYTNGNVGYVQFNVACNRPFENAQGEKETDFIFVVAWKELAEVIVKYLRVGRKVYVEGRLQVRSYDDDQNVKRYITEIVAEKIDFLDSPPDDVKNQNGQQGQNNNRGNQNQGSNQGNPSQGNNRNYQNQGNNNQGNNSQGSNQAKNQWNRNQGNNNSGYKNLGNNQGNRSQGNNNNRNYQNQGSNQGNQTQNSSNGKMPWEK